MLCISALIITALPGTISVVEMILTSSSRQRGRLHQQRRWSHEIAHTGLSTINPSLSHCVYHCVFGDQLRPPVSCPVWTSGPFVPHIPTFKAFHTACTGVHHVLSISMFDSEGNLQSLRRTVLKHEHLSPERLDMFQFIILAAQTHSFKAACRLPKTLQLPLQQRIRDEWGNT